MKNIQTETIEQPNGKITNYLKDKLKDVHLRELLKGSSISMIIKVLGIAMSYIFTLMVTRNFGVEAMGIFAISLTMLNIVSIIGRLGFDTALLRFVAEYSSQDKWEKVREVYIKAIKLVIPLCIILSILFFFVSPYVAKYFFKKEYLTSYFRLISIAILPMSVKFINQESLRGLRKIKEYTFFQNVSVYLFSALFLACFMFFTREKYVPVVSLLASVFFVAIFSLCKWIKCSKFTTTITVNTIKINNILAVSLPMLLSNSIYFIMQWTDTIMLGMLRTVNEVGVYNVTLKVAPITSISLLAINSIAAPKFAEFYGKGDMKGLEKTVHHSTKIIFWSSFPILLIFFIFPSWILGLFGEEFKAGVYALLLLTIGQFVNAISGSVGYFLTMTGKQNIHQKILLIAITMNIIINALLIPKYGINGAAFASFICMVFWNLSMVFYIKKEFNFFMLYIPYVKKIWR